MTSPTGGSCWSCGAALTVLDYGRQDTCRKCGRDTRVCKGCEHYDRGANNDCRDPMAPDGVISLTIDGTQTDAAQIITLCIPRPDLLMVGDPMPIGTGIRIIDLLGEKDGCTYAFESTRPVTGTVAAIGMCDNGTNDAGYALNFDGNISLRRMCPTMSDTIAVGISGKVAVAQKML